MVVAMTKCKGNGQKKIPFFPQTYFEECFPDWWHEQNVRSNRWPIGLWSSSYNLKLRHNITQCETEFSHDFIVIVSYTVTSNNQCKTGWRQHFSHPFIFSKRIPLVRVITHSGCCLRCLKFIAKGFCEVPNFMSKHRPYSLVSVSRIQHG